MINTSDEHIINLKDLNNQQERELINQEHNVFQGIPAEDYNNSRDNSRNSDNFIEWRAEEHNYLPKSGKWFIFLAVFFGVLEIYFLWTQNFSAFATFLFIFFVVFLYSIKKPRTLRFKIDYQGIWVDGRLYKFDNFQSFWVFYDPPHKKEICLRGKTMFVNFLDFPIGNNDPMVLRENLKKYLPEIQEEESLIDVLMRKIGL